ncbi:MAG: amidohydrolase family protein [Pseudomonadota bacterium]
MTAGSLTIQGARVMLPDADPHHPPFRDVHIANGRIARISASGEPPQEGTEVIDGRGKLLVPGFVNAHYHSYDVLAKGLMEDMPFDLWALLSQPAYWGKRSPAELRLRTLIGGLECLKNGVTCVQDMNTIVPHDEAALDTILSAYEELGIRVVLSLAVRDVAALDIAPFMSSGLPPDIRHLVDGVPGDAAAELAFVSSQIDRIGHKRPCLHWAISPSGPQRCSARLLAGLSDLAENHGLPILTHVYETRAQLAKARSSYPEHQGSLIKRLADTGLLGPKTTIAHSIWITPEEIDALAEAGASVAHNPMANLKLKSGIAPLLDLEAAGVNIALGCDNCSCGDTQNMFQAMKLFTLLAGAMDGHPTGVGAAEALRSATTGGAQAVGLQGEVGAIAEGMRADFSLIDLSDIAFQPFNSAVRQLVYSECGRGISAVVVDGRVVLRDGKATGVDEGMLYDELAELMVEYTAEFTELKQRQSPAFPHLVDANRRIAEANVGMDRFIPRAGAHPNSRETLS